MQRQDTFFWTIINKADFYFIQFFWKGFPTGQSSFVIEYTYFQPSWKKYNQYDIWNIIIWNQANRDHCKNIESVIIICILVRNFQRDLALFKNWKHEKQQFFDQLLKRHYRLLRYDKNKQIFFYTKIKNM